MEKYSTNKLIECFKLKLLDILLGLYPSKFLYVYVGSELHTTASQSINPLFVSTPITLFLLTIILCASVFFFISTPFFSNSFSKASTIFPVPPSA